MLQSVPSSVDSEENEEQNGEAPKRGTSIAEEGQGNSYDWCQPQYHSDIDEDVEEEDAQHTITIYPTKRIWLPFSKMHKSQYE